MIPVRIRLGGKRKAAAALSIARNMMETMAGSSSPSSRE
jgi:hypothetical protein